MVRRDVKKDEIDQYQLFAKPGFNFFDFMTRKP